MESLQNRGKVGIIGVGDVGADLAFALTISGIIKNVVLIDANKEKALGEAMDLMHAASFTKPIKIWAGSYTDLDDAEIIVITAGAAQKPGETRLDLTIKNSKILSGIIKDIIKVNTHAILLIVTNPVDVLTYVAQKISGFPASRVFGSGTVLDSARFRALLSERCKIDSRNIHAYIIGEHGDTEVAVWSLTNVGGTLLEEFCLRCEEPCNSDERLEIANRVKNAAYEIIKYKGSTSYAISLSLLRIIEAILRDENSILPVSTFVHDYQGVSDVVISVPCIINRTGVSRIVDLNLSDDEKTAFQKSAATIKDAIEKINKSGILD